MNKKTNPRVEFINIRVTVKEKNLIRAKATEADLEFSEYVRAKLDL